MAEIFACALEHTRYFNIMADNEEQVMEWLQTHSAQDVDNLTKEYLDEYDERICDDDRNYPGLKPHINICKANSDLENESEVETVNDKMMQLKKLIDESKKIMDDVRAETTRINKEHEENKRNQLHELQAYLKEHLEMIPNFSYMNDYFPVSQNRIYEIRLDQVQTISVVKNGHYIGRLSTKDSYETANNSLRTTIGNTYIYNLEHFLNSFDKELFEEEFTAAVTKAITRQSEQIDAAYQEAKEALEND